MMKTREMKNKIYEIVAGIGSACSSPKRLELIDLLCQGEKTVEMLTEQSGANVKIISAHLKVLKIARLVVSRKAGKFVYYNLANDDVAKFWVRLRVLAGKQFLEIEYTLNEFFNDRHDLTKIDRKNLLKQAKRGDVIILDVRSEDEFNSAHIPFSLNIPISQLKRRLSEIPKNKEVVAYCRGPYCVFAHEAVNTLKKKGYKVKRLVDGVADWKELGFL